MSSTEQQSADRKKLRVFQIRQALLAKAPNRSKECSKSAIACEAQIS